MLLKSVMTVVGELKVFVELFKVLFQALTKLKAFFWRGERSKAYIWIESLP
jgi:hypothetical protein